MAARKRKSAPVIPTVAIRTLGTWSVADVGTFGRVFDELYGVFLAVQLAAKRVRAESSNAWGSATLSDYVLRQVPRDHTSTEWDPLPQRAPVSSLPADLPFGPEVRYLRFLYDNRYRLDSQAEPFVAYWHMASPGEIKIGGVGSILRQVRELIKDLKYRNRQEEQLGELELARKKLELSDSLISPPARDFMASIAIEKYGQLTTMEMQGKLLLGDGARAPARDLLDMLLEGGRRFPELRDLSEVAAQLIETRQKAAWDKLWAAIDREIDRLEERKILPSDIAEPLHDKLSDVRMAEFRERHAKER